MIYTAESRALAMAEVAVHLTLATLPSDFAMIEIEIPDTIKIKEIKPKDLSENWNTHPPNRSTQKIGDEFIDSGDGLLKVPSAVVPGDCNILINPYNKDFKKIKIISIVDFPFDSRMFK